MQHTTETEDVPAGACRGQMPSDPHTAINGFPAGNSFDMQHVVMPAPRSRAIPDIDRDAEIATFGAVRGTQ